MVVEVDIPKEKWAGKVREVTLGATASEGGSRARTVTVGGETTLPFLRFEGEMTNPPAVAVEVQDRRPDGWSPIVLEAWGEVVGDPGAWARQAERLGADLILLRLSATDGQEERASPQEARASLRKVLEATGLPVLVFGPGEAELDNDLLVAVAEEGVGERLVLGICEDKNYRTIVAAALAHGHLVNARSPIDVNLAKQLNILISDMGLGLDRVLMDPTTGALGYGIEYSYSVMERLRLAAFQGDAMTQQPMLVTPGEEAWRVKEARVGEDVPEAWGDWERRGINWEVLTASTLLQAGADILVMRHPKAVTVVKETIERLLGS
jgi:acetyl-CoA decarbonylase/synthase complex subunit delta